MQTVVGDLLDYLSPSPLNPVDAVAHVCNCQGAMNSGVAKALRSKFPEVYTAYRDFGGRVGNFPLGTISVANVSHNRKQVYNLHAQKHYGYDGKRYLNYEALYACLEQTRDGMLEKWASRLAVPFKMGCDRAGGNWKIVSTMIEEVFANAGIEVLAVRLP